MLCEVSCCVVEYLCRSFCSFVMGMEKIEIVRKKGNRSSVGMWCVKRRDGPMNSTQGFSPCFIISKISFDNPVRSWLPLAEPVSYFMCWSQSQWNRRWALILTWILELPDQWWLPGEDRQAGGRQRSRHSPPLLTAQCSFSATMLLL